MQEKSILESQADMAAGTETARSIAAAYLDRIAALDRAGPQVNSVIEINPDALQIADERDRERRERGPRSRLHGIPVLIKDNIDTADRLQTTAGSRALSGNIAAKDAHLARLLREAGAVILGKTNLSEWANFRSTRSTSGWSSRGGQTRNPYALDRSPCGSSSGSAAAVAANFCTAAVGTETDGSIICPAANNGIVGIKPTIGLVSRSGIIPISHSQDTAGPMARTVTDAVILLGAIAGPDPQDPVTVEGEKFGHRDYTRFLLPDGLEGARIGIARNFFGGHPRVDAIMESAIHSMEENGAVIVDKANIETIEQFRKTELEVLLYEFKHDLNLYLATLSANIGIRSLKDLIRFNAANAEVMMPYFGQEILIQAQEKGPLSEKAYLEALAENQRLTRNEGIDRVITDLRLDAIVAPSNAPAWLIDWVRGDSHSGGSSSTAAVAGYPVITVPAGYIHGLPIGISFFSTAYQEPALIRIAYAFEQATLVREKPGFARSVRLH